MLNASEDLAAILADCGGSALTAEGEITGRLVEEPVELETSSGRIVQTAELVFYTGQRAIDAVALVVKAWIEIDGVRYFVRDIPRADAAGVVRMVLSR